MNLHSPRAPLLRSLVIAAALSRTPNLLHAQAAAPVDSTCHSAAAQDTLVPLFIIERNKNANIVCYDARLRAGRLNSRDPVAVYWVMNAQRGQYEGLNWLERWFAYGFDLDRVVDSTVWRMSMRAYRPRKVVVREQAADSGAVLVHAEVCIAGRQARFDRLYIMARERPFPRRPRVLYVDLFGRDLLTGDSLTERIVADSAANAPQCPPS